MALSDLFYMDVKRVSLMHEFLLERSQSFEYPHGRMQYGLVYAIDGDAEYRFFGGERCTLHEGELMLLSPRAAYSLHGVDAFRHYTVNFEIHEDCSDTSFLRESCYLIHADSDGQYKHMLKQMHAIWQSKRIGYEMQMISRLYELLALLCTDLYAQRHGSVYSRLLPAKKYVDQSFHQPIDLEHLAAAVNMSVTHFRREWNRVYHMSPMQYRDQLRLSYAKECLLSGYYNVSETALRCGFEDVNYFVRFFKKQTGMTPGAYRKHCEQTPEA